MRSPASRSTTVTPRERDRFGAERRGNGEDAAASNDPSSLCQACLIARFPRPPDGLLAKFVSLPTINRQCVYLPGCPAPLPSPKKTKLRVSFSVSPPEESANRPTSLQETPTIPASVYKKLNTRYRRACKRYISPSATRPGRSRSRCACAPGKPSGRHRRISPSPRPPTRTRFLH